MSRQEQFEITVLIDTSFARVYKQLMSSSPPPSCKSRTGSHVDYWFARGWITAEGYKGAMAIIEGRLTCGDVQDVNELLERIGSIDKRV